MAPSRHPCTPEPTPNIYTNSSHLCMCVRVMWKGRVGRRGTEHLPVDLHDRAIVHFGLVYSAEPGLASPPPFPFSPSQETIAPLLNIATATLVPFSFFSRPVSTPVAHAHVHARLSKICTDSPSALLISSAASDSFVQRRRTETWRPVEKQRLHSFFSRRRQMILGNLRAGFITQSMFRCVSRF